VFRLSRILGHSSIDTTQFTYGSHQLDLEFRFALDFQARQFHFMPSARTQCPACQDDAHIVDLRDLLYSPQVDYFRCRACGCWWIVSKGEDWPATRLVLGNTHSQ